MSNKAKTPLVPKLRFPEFRQTSGWTPKRLKDACEVNPANSALPERFVYIDLESVEAGKLTARKIINRDEAPSRAQRLLYLNDVIFQIVRPYQRNNFHFKVSEDLDHVASTGYAQLRAKDSADFLYQAVHVDGFVDQVIAKCTGSSYPAINSSDLAEVPIAIPEPAEQQQIADCLSSLDELIAVQTRKVDALKTHKKGLMQQLFPREGETQPRLRFPEFRDAGEWHRKSLGAFCRVGDIDHRMPASVDNGIPYIMTGDFLGINDIDFNGAKKVSADDYVSLSAKIKPERGDIVVARYASVGAVRYIETDIRFLVSYSCAIVKCVSSDNSKYLYYVFQSDWVQSNIGMQVNTSSQKNIGIDSIKKLPIRVPGILEQKRVADCLTSLDTLIAAASQELETLKTHKKGLMQQLFPASDETPR